MACDERTGCPPTTDCKTEWDLTRSNDKCFVDKVVNEALNIAGAQINVFKLLGIHEQQLLMDQVGNGSPLTSGNPSAFPVINAFTNNSLEWRSTQKGADVVTSAFIGYDFGTIKLSSGRERYGIDTSIRKLVSTIVIKQGAHRVTRARIERSDDGLKWYGAAIIDLEDDAAEHTISFKRSVPSRYWRIRPLEFQGGTADPWNVERLQLVFYNDTRLENFDEDPLFIELRNRDYANETIEIKGSYDLIDVQAEMNKIGFDVPAQQLYIQVAFSSVVELLGRPLIIGDILELPNETQYDAHMNPIKKYLEVTDVGWSTEGYGPSWQPTVLRVIAQPALASQETQDVFGDLKPKLGADGFLDLNTDKYADLTDATDRITNAAKDAVPERGTDLADVAEISQEVIQANLDATGNDLSKLNINPKSLYTEDALPPNGEEYTVGDDFPTNPIDGAYHRMTYSGLAEDVPPRLYRWSIIKNRWLYIETDRRFQYNKTKPTLQEFLESGVSLKKVEK